MKLTAIFEPAIEGGYVAWVEEIPEAMSQGETLKEAKSNLQDALNLILEYRHEEAQKQLKRLKAKNIKVKIEKIV